MVRDRGLRQVKMPLDLTDTYLAAIAIQDVHNLNAYRVAQGFGQGCNPFGTFGAEAQFGGNRGAGCNRTGCASALKRAEASLYLAAMFRPCVHKAGVGKSEDIE
jgi:hypothetical protein